MKKRNELKASKRSGTSAEALTKAERNFKPYAFMIWFDQYLQMREGRKNIAAATREDDTEECHSNTGGLIVNPINSNTSQGFTDVESVPSDNSEMENSYKPVTKLSKKNRKTKEEVVDDAELDLMRDMWKGFAAKRKRGSVADTSEDLLSKQLAADLKSLPAHERCLAQQELQQVMFRYKLNTFKRREVHQNIDKQKFSSPTDFKELSQTPNRFGFPYISSPYQRMISPKPHTESFKASQL